MDGVVAGKVIRFDEIRGYGFIAPDNGSDDVFVHVNDLLDGKAHFHPGQQVEFEVEDGGRGLKASGVRIVAPQNPLPANALTLNAVGTEPQGGGADGEDSLCDLLSRAELELELTEALLAVLPTLTGEQILAVRRRFTELASAHNWVET